MGYQDDYDLYSYVGNDPYSKADPSGKVAFMVPVAVAAWRIYNAIDTVQTAVNNVTVLASATATTGEKIAAGVELAGSLVGGRSGRQAAGSAVRAVEGGEKVLYRRGAHDTRETLKTQSKAAEKEPTVGIHGVSTTTNPTTTKPGQVVRCAKCSDVEAAGFKVTKTGKDLDHYTVELPKPIAPDVTRTFNELFK